MLGAGVSRAGRCTFQAEEITSSVRLPSLVKKKKCHFLMVFCSLYSRLLQKSIDYDVMFSF